MTTNNWTKEGVAHSRAEDWGLCFGTLTESFALTAWADAWASAIEWDESGRDFGSFAGCELTEICPTVPAEFQAFALESVVRIISEAPDSSVRAWGEFDDSDRIGSDMYMDAVGHGCGLADRDLPTFHSFTETPWVDADELEDVNGNRA